MSAITGGRGGLRAALGRTTFRSLKHRNYRLYFAGQFVSLTGTWMQTAALAWLAFDLTHKASWPAFVMAAHMTPAFLFGTLGGWLADHFSKRRIVFFSQCAFLCVTSVLAVLTLSGVATVWHLLVLMAFHGLVMAADLPARLAFVPSLIPREDLINAVALNSVLFNAARLVGPMAAGVILISWGPGVCFLINALSYFPVLFALHAIRIDESNDRVRVPAGGVWEAVTGGVSAVARQPRLAALIGLSSAVAFLGWPLLSLLPAFADQGLGMAERAYSNMLSAVGGGALLAALVVATFSESSRQRWFLLAGVAIIGAALHGLASSTVQWSAVLCCGAFGFGMILFFPTGQSMVQLRAEDAYRGRVMALWALTISAAVPTGNVLFGPLADSVGVATVIRGQAFGATAIVLSGVILLLGIGIGRRSRRVATERALTGPPAPVD